MAKQPERACQPLLTTQPDTRFYCFPETTESSPCLSSKLLSEEGQVRQKKRRREDPEEGPNPSERLRITTGPQPPLAEEVEKAEDSAEAHEDSRAAWVFGRILGQQRILQWFQLNWRC
ncbi:unnamed protein product [Lota lota]